MAIAATYVIRKSISTEVKPVTFSVWWYGFAGTYAWISTLVRGQIREAGHIRSSYGAVIALVLLNAAGGLLYFTEIDLTNPALVAFFGRLRTAYIVLLGILVLKERLNRQEWMGTGIVILGTLIIAYKGGVTLSVVFLLALLENLLMAASTMAAKFAVKQIPPLVLAAYRGTLVSMIILVYALATGQWQPISGGTLAVIAGGALVGPFIGYVLNYASLARIDAGKVAIVAATQPLFVTGYTALLFGDWPTLQQALGGALTIVGVILVFYARSKGSGRPTEE